MDWMQPTKSYNPVKEEDFPLKQKKAFHKGKALKGREKSDYLNCGRLPSLIAAAKYLSGSLFQRLSALDDQK